MPNQWGKISGVMERLDELRAQADASFARVSREHAQAVACKPGCDDCCHALFDLAPVEALAIAKAVQELPRKTRREITRRAEKAAGLFDDFVSGALRKQGEERMKLLSQARVPCPLLAEKRCAVYSQRPITCRLYGIPVAIHGQGRTCHLARFQPGKSYPTASMDQVQERLARLSAELLELVPGLPTHRQDAARCIKMDTEF